MCAVHRLHQGMCIWLHMNLDAHVRSKSPPCSGFEVLEGADRTVPAVRTVRCAVRRQPGTHNTCSH